VGKNKPGFAPGPTTTSSGRTSTFLVVETCAAMASRNEGAPSGAAYLVLPPRMATDARLDDVFGRGEPGLPDLQVDDIAALAFQRGGLGQHRVRALVLQIRHPIARARGVAARGPDHGRGAARRAARGAARGTRQSRGAARGNGVP
jgi:hypothetical protein